VELTPAGLCERAGRWARLLHDRGVSRGDRIGLLADNSATYVEVLAGAARIGAAVVLLNPRLTPTDLGDQLADAGAAATLADRQRAGAVPGAWILEELEAGVATAVPLDTVPGLHPDRPFLLLYTSGTTGPAKGCVLSHRAWAASAANTVAALDLGAHDRYLGRAPFFHVAGLSVATGVLAAGGAVVFDGSRSPSLEEQWQLAVRLRTTVASFSGSLPDMTRAAPASSALRVVFGQAGRWSAAQHEEAAARLPGVRFAGFYGQTEAGNFVTRTTREDERVRPGTVGRLLPSFRAAVLDEHLRQVPPGRSGELCVRGPSTMTGYWGRPEATADALRGGWLHTGDVMRADEDG
jgi:acyl-CoA synthetase (AMP-forming)/AMP-acid ligase II